MTRGHLGAHMLYGLETADQAAELFALASIIDSLFDHRLTCAKTVGGQDNTACITQPGRCNSPIISQWFRFGPVKPQFPRSEEHTSELQSLMRTSYAVFCLKKKKKAHKKTQQNEKRQKIQ